MITAAPISANRMSHDEALLYCLFCNHDGHNDWRMPFDTEYGVIMQAGLGMDDAIRLIGWTQDDGKYNNAMLRHVTPVRDI